MSIEIPINVNMEVEESQMAFDMEVDEEIDVTVIQGTDVSDTTAVEADVLEGKKFHKADGSLATGIHSGSPFVKLAEKEFTVNTNNTSVVQVGTITIDPASDVFTDDYYILVTIRDKAGKRNGYFFGTDNIYSNVNAANGSTSLFSTAGRLVYSCNSNGNYVEQVAAYGVYAYYITSTGEISIVSRYHSSYSLTINGTYVVEVWALPYAPNANPFA